MLIGYLYLRFSNHWRNISFNFRKKFVELKTTQKKKVNQRDLKLQQEVDMLMDKANICGWESLSDEEQTKLQSSSWKLSFKKPKD
ncbi:MAG TPA: hypothetical protein ENL09_02725 [Bacteroidetes bacterium]|nr:hypothetical protein [Bacteroidota bacterium]